MARKNRIKITQRPQSGIYGFGATGSVDERIIEFSTGTMEGPGGLIAFILNEDGSLDIQPYRCDGKIRINGREVRSGTGGTELA